MFVNRFIRPATVLASILIGAAAPAFAQETAPPDWVSDPALIAEGRALYGGTCRDCHGRQGDEAALGQSRPIADLAPAEIVDRLTELRDTGDLSAMQNRIKSTLSDDDIRALAAYVATLADETLE